VHLVADSQHLGVIWVSRAWPSYSSLRGLEEKALRGEEMHAPIFDVSTQRIFIHAQSSNRYIFVNLLPENIIRMVRRVALCFTPGVLRVFLVPFGQYLVHF
jgi:hypothetical protein